MSPVYRELSVQVAPRPTVNAVIAKVRQLNVVAGVPEVIVVSAANVGPPGPRGAEGKWVSMTQAEFNALFPKDPETLYVIIG